jgi:type II secretory pathway component PulC
VFQRIEIINRLLIIVLVLLLGGFVYTVAFGRPSIEKTVRHFPRPPVRAVKANNQEAFMPSDEYVKMSKQRDIFNREQRTAVERSAVADKPAIPRTKTDLQLVGIYFSEEPEVIIEDKVEKKTYFLKEGENIKEIKVKNIRPDRVILESDGTEWELM